MAELNTAFDCTLNKATIKLDKEFIDTRDNDGYCITPKAIEYNPNVTANEYKNNRCLSQFTKADLQPKTCIKTADWGSFKRANAGPIKPLEKFPNGNRNAELIKMLNESPKHDYYQFFPDYQDKCRRFPPQRLFNNLTRRSTLMNPHFAHDIAPQYLA